MSLINVVDLTFSYEGSYDNIFEHTSFQIDSDWKLGFVGRNGKGKTTFLNLLMGKYEYSGTISTNMEFEYFPYEVTGEEREKDTLEILQGICPQAEDWEIIRELSLLNVDAEVLYRPYNTLSNGEQTKVLLVGLFLKENTYLLIDEPTNHLDVEARETLSKYLQKKKSFILVSHDRVFLDSCIDHVLSINRADIEIQKGNFSSWQENRRMQDQFELAEHAKLKKDIKRLKSASRQADNWSAQVEKTKKGVRTGGLRPDRGFIGHKAAKMMKRSKNLEKRQQEQIEEKSKLLKNLEESESLKVTSLTFHQEKAAELEGVSVWYDGKKACGPVNLTVRQGAKCALRGKNGCGKSSILKLLCEPEKFCYSPAEELSGAGAEYTGTIRRNPQLVISYVPQDASGLRGDLKEYADAYGISESLFKAILRKLGFEREQFEKRIEDYSAGQKKKVMLARSMCEQAHLYVWDEPLNYIDVISRMQIEEMICNSEMTLLFVEHDRAFCKNIGAEEKWI